MSEHTTASPPPRRSSGPRDLLVVGVLVAVVFGLGLAFDAFDLIGDLLVGWAYQDESIALALMLIVGLSIVTLRRSAQARRERALRHDTEATAARTEARFRTIVERVPAVAYVWDSADDRESSPATYISPQIGSLLGYTSDAWLSDPHAWSDRVHPEDVSRVLAGWCEASARVDVFAAEYRLRRADGRWVWIRDEANPVGVGDRGRQIYQGVMFDITERREAEQRLRDLEHRWRTLLESLPVTAFTIEYDLADPAVLHSWWVAPGIRRLVGVPPEEWTADRDSWASHLHPDDREGALAAWRADMQDGGSRDAQYRLVHRDGRSVWVREQTAVVVQDGRLRADGVFIDVTEQREAEAALGHAEARYQSLVEQLPVAVYTDAVDEFSTALYISPRYEALTGYAPEQRLSDPELWVRMLHPEDRDAVLAESERTNATGEPFDIEYRIVAADGHTVWLHDHAMLVEEAGGRRVWQGVLQDITERRLAQDALSDTQRRYQTLVEHIPAITYIDDTRTGTIVYASPQLVELLGYSTDEWNARYPEMLHPDDRARVLEEDHRAEVTGEDFRVQYRVVKKDGEVVWVGDEAVLIRGDDGAPLYWQGVMFDLTETKAAEARLRDAEERYRGIVEHVPAAIYVDRADRSMETIYVSPQIEEIVGVTPEEWMADPELWIHMMEDEDRDAVVAGYLRAAETGTPWHAEYRLRRRDGRIIWVHDETTFLHDEHGAPSFMQGVIYDVTERKLAEQALRESERRERDAAERLRALDEMKNTFLAAVSHELRSPLTSILGLSLTLERTPTLTDVDRDDLLHRLAANARKLDRLLKDLLDIDRLNRGIVEPQLRQTDVGALVRRTIESLDQLAGREVASYTEAVVIPVDAPKVERIVENLVLNAARHTPADRRIWVRVEPWEGGALLSVDDDGPGVPEDLRAEIFDPFRQGPSASTHAPGTGIGLSLVGRFAEMHGGRAWVEERVGGGASFRVALPGERPDPAAGNGSALDGLAASTAEVH